MPFISPFIKPGSELKAVDPEPVKVAPLPPLVKLREPPVAMPTEHEESQASSVIVDNLSHLLSSVSYLYVGNLSPEVSERMLAAVFSKFGALRLVKLMLPRNEDERRRRRNCGFVKFESY